MREGRLEEIKDRIENFDVGRYHGVDMLADALTDIRWEARELVDEIESLQESLRQGQSDAWEKGMADAKLQALGIRPLVRNPYLED